MAIHPDDPPLPLFGLPRVVSTAADCKFLLAAVDTKANGLTLCTGSYGSRADNDVPAMAAEFASRIHFVHLRNVTVSPNGSFLESNHLEGDVDMYQVMVHLLTEQKRRRAAGLPEAECRLPFRPDHGHKLLHDIADPRTNPGYPAVGRLRGLAELRGLQLGVLRAHGSAHQPTPYV
jgi:mannonate dehydratase